MSLELKMHFYTFRYPIKIAKWFGMDLEYNSKWKVIFCYLNIFVNMFLMLTTLYMFKITPFEINGLSNILETLILIFHGTLKMVTLHFKASNILDLLNRTEQFWRPEKLKNHKFTKKFLTIQRYMEYNVIMFYILGILALVLFLLPIVQGKQTFETYNPGFPKCFIGFINIYVMIFGIFLPIISFDSFYVLLANSAYQQLKLLNGRSSIFVRERYGIFIKDNIKEWVDHHNRVLEFIKQLNLTFSTPLLFYFGLVISTLGLELFIITSKRQNLEEALKSLLYLAGVIYEFTLHFCLPGQLLINEANKISTKWFFTSWYRHFNKSLTYAARMIIMKGQSIPSIKVGKIVSLDFPTCVSAYKSTFSYFMFLKTMNNKGIVNNNEQNTHLCS